MVGDAFPIAMLLRISGRSGPFDVEPRAIADIGALGTTMNGRFTHRDEIKPRPHTSPLLIRGAS